MFKFKAHVTLASLLLISYKIMPLRGDKHVTSPYNIHTLSNKQVMRILWVEVVILISLQILPTNLLGNVYQLEGRICGHILGVKG